MMKNFREVAARQESSEALSDRVRRLREDRGMSQAELARLAGRSATHVWQIEKGERTHMRFETARSYAEALGVSTHELLFGYEEGDHHNLPPLAVCLRAYYPHLTEQDMSYILGIIGAIANLESTK